MLIIDFCRNLTYDNQLMLRKKSWLMSLVYIFLKAKTYKFPVYKAKLFVFKEWS